MGFFVFVLLGFLVVCFVFFFFNLACIYFVQLTAFFT